jgi:Extensin-like protein C-terminus
MRWCLALGLSACLAPDAATGSDGGPGGADARPPFSVTVTAPAAGAQFARDYLYIDGTWVARVTFKAQVSPAAPQVDWMAGGLVRGVGLPPDYAYEAIYATDGSDALSAVVHDVHGAELGRADTSIAVLPSTVADGDCAAKLSVLGIASTGGPATLGIAHPVTVTVPLHGMPFSGRTSLVMECDFALDLWRMVDVLKAHHVTALTVGGSGLYNYRCVSGSEPPPCAQSGFSLHAFGLAIDLAAVDLDDGTSASVGGDWIVDAGPTCDVSSASPRNQRLHDIVCDLYQNGVFTVVLTPDFQASQGFVHFDETVGQMVIQ